MIKVLLLALVFLGSPSDEPGGDRNVLAARISNSEARLDWFDYNSRTLNSCFDFAAVPVAVLRRANNKKPISFVRIVNCNAAHITLPGFIREYDRREGGHPSSLSGNISHYPLFFVDRHPSIDIKIKHIFSQRQIKSGLCSDVLGKAWILTS